MDERLKKLLEWLQRNQGGNPYAHKDPWHPFSKWGNEGINPVPMPKIEVDPDGVNPVPMPQMLPKDIPDWWKRGEKFPLDTGPRKEWWNKRAPYFPKEADKFPRRKFDGNKDDFLQLLKDAQVGSAMPKYHSGQRKNIRDLSTEMATDPLSYVSDNVRGPQLGGVPEGDRKFVDTMHNIQNAYYTGADFGYEEGWPEQLGATQEQIDMFMAVPEGAIRHAMENPTDAVLQQFEEYYGFPLNVNDRGTQRWVDDFKSSKYRKGPSLGFEGVHKNVDGQGMSRLKKDDEGYYAIYDPEGVGSDPSDKRVGARILIPPSMVNNLGLNVGDYIPDDDYIVEHGVLKRKR